MKKPILEDQERKPLTYLDLIRAAFALGRKIAGFTSPGEHVGLMLPSSSAGVVTFFALHAFGRVPTMLNFTSGIRNLKAACEVAGVKTVLTSHRFVEQGKLHDLIDALETRAKVVYLEEVRKSLGTSDKLFAAVAGAFPKTSPDGHRTQRAGRHPLHLRQLRRAQGRRADPGQPGRQLPADRPAHRARSQLGVLQSPADLPLLRPDRRRPAAAAHGAEGVPVPLAAAHQADPAAGEGHRRRRAAGHRHLHQPVRPLGRTRRTLRPDLRGLRRREGPRRDP